MWRMLSAPLLIGCDMDRLDPFTVSLLSNDEVLALDQAALGRQAVRVAANGAVDIYLKELEDGSPKPSASSTAAASRKPSP